MNIFDWFKEKGRKPGLRQVQVTFTPEETEVLKRNRAAYATMAPPGKVMHVTEKAGNAIDALGLFEYVLGLMAQARYPDLAEHQRKQVLMKASQAQAKVCALHDFPYYVYMFAHLSNVNGETEQAKRLYAIYLKQQSEFVSGPVDEITFDYICGNDWIDEPRAIAESEGFRNGTVLNAICEMVQELMSAPEIAEQCAKQPQKQRSNFMMAYASYILWIVQKSCARFFSPVEIERIILAAQSRITVFPWFAQGRFGTISPSFVQGYFDTLSTTIHERLDNMRPGPHTGILIPMVHVVEAANELGCALTHTTDASDVVYTITVSRVISEQIEALCKSMK